MRLFFALYFLILSNVILAGQEIKINKIENLNIYDKNMCFYPQFSPDGKKIFFTSENYQGISEYDLDKKILLQINNYLGSGLSPILTKDGSHLVFRKEILKNRKKYFSIIAYNFETKSENIIEKENRSLTIPFKSTTGDIVYKKKNRFHVYSHNLNNKINSFSGKLIDTNNSNLVLYENNNPVSLTYSEDSRYLWTSISPDQSLILFTKAGEGTFISDLHGNIIVNLGYANAPVWSPNGKWIAYMDDKDNGEFYTESDIIVVSADGLNKYKITDTNDEIEMYPQWDPKGNRLVFNTIAGKIKIAHLKFEENE